MLQRGPQQFSPTYQLTCLYRMAPCQSVKEHCRNCARFRYLQSIIIDLLRFFIRCTPLHPRDNPFVSIHVSKLIESMYPFNATLPFIPLPRRIKPRCKTFQNHVFANHSLSFLRTFLLASTKISLFRNKLLSRWVEHLFDITVAHDSTRKLGRSIDRSIPRRQRHPLGPFYSCQVAVRLHGNKLGFNFS